MTEDGVVKAMDEAYLNTTPHGDAMRAAYHVAREQALREAAEVCGNMLTSFGAHDAILALIEKRD